MLYFLTFILCILAIAFGTPELKGAVVTVAIFVCIGIAANLTGRKDKGNE